MRRGSGLETVKQAGKWRRENRDENKSKQKTGEKRSAGGEEREEKVNKGSEG